MIAQRTEMRTHTGQPIWFLDPSQTEVNWHDLTMGCVRQRRYAGHLDVTIAQHLGICVGLARLRGYTPREVALCAAHDLHEAYVLDVPKGLKELIPEYQEIEARWEEHVHAQLGLEMPTRLEARLVKAVDVRALALEIQAWGWSGWAPGEGVLAIEGAPSNDELRLVEEARRTWDVHLMGTVRKAVEGAVHVE